MEGKEFGKKRFVLVPLDVELADKICEISDMNETDPTTVLNSGVKFLTDSYFKQFDEPVEHECCCCEPEDNRVTVRKKEDIAEVVSNDELVKAIFELCKTSHCVSIDRIDLKVVVNNVEHT